MACPIRPMVGRRRRAGGPPPTDPDPQLTDLSVQTPSIRLYLYPQEVMDMMEGTGARARARAQRQERVAKIVWGSLFVVMGVLFTLHDLGRIDLGEPAHKFDAGHAVDGNPKTRWSSAFSDPQWLTVDLGADAPLSRVRLHWEAAYAKDYELQVSSDGVNWTTARRVTDAGGGIEQQGISATARYVRLMGTRRATPYGYSLWELEIFDSEGALISRGKPATASSVEDHGAFGLWLRFWPLLVVASGLPLLLAPRDDTTQVVGMVLTAGGAFLQLQGLALVSWGVQQALSIVLMVVGVVILLQSLRRRERPDEGGAGPSGD
ncbi:MAG TPA: discoidin domain-containing protein, partial [Vicinamibacteria bacterium]|nr:discoidin domain-containing protein [Vicinamibacteria bacterium]